MDNPALLGVARRRWYVIALGVLASLGLGLAAAQTSPPQFTARALVMLLPSETTVGVDGNPFLELSGLDLPARVVVSSMSSSSTRDEIADEFPEITYVVSIEESTRGPVIAIDVTGSSEDATLDALPFLIFEATSTLDRIQNDVDAAPASSVQSMVLAADSSAEEDRGGTLRLAIAGVVLGLVATVLAAGALDGRQRSARKQVGRGVSPVAGAAPEPHTYPMADSPQGAVAVFPEAQPVAQPATQPVESPAPDLEPQEQPTLESVLEPTPDLAAGEAVSVPGTTPAPAEARTNGTSTARVRTARNRGPNRGAGRAKRPS